MADIRAAKRCLPVSAIALLACHLCLASKHGTPCIEVVGWSGGKRDVAPLARRAIKGLATMLTQHTCLHYQSEADAVKVSMHP